MDTEEFRKFLANPKTIVGASLLLKIPSGDYEPDKLINIGANRWAAKPAVGAILPLRPTLLLECEIGAWFYGNNDEFLGQTRKQKPVISTEAHLVKITRSGVWASLDINYYRGGRTSIGKTYQEDPFRNSRLGGTLFYPWKGHHGLKASYSKGIVTTSGGVQYDRAVVHLCLAIIPA